MPTTKTKALESIRASADSDVLTLAETAAYLRVPEEVVLQMFRDQGLPGRRVGNEWRFLRSALNDWLSTPVTKSRKEALLAMAGAWKDDPYLDEMLLGIYQQRGRPMAEGSK